MIHHRGVTAFALTAALRLMFAAPAAAAPASTTNTMEPLNLSPAASLAASFTSGHESLAAVGDGYTPKDSGDHSRGAYGNWPQRGTQWVELAWPEAISADAIEVFWWDDNRGVRLPRAARVSYWDGVRFVPIAAEVGVLPDRFNAARFDAVRTTKLRLEIDSRPDASTGVIEWRVFDAGTSPAFAPSADAGPDRVAVLPSPTYLHGSGKAVRRSTDAQAGRWSKAGGPGEVTFANAAQPDTTATFSQTGEYELGFTYESRGKSATDTLKVRVETPPDVARKLNAVYVSSYKVAGPFWRERLKNQIVNWIPHCIERNDDPNLKEGGINNIVEAGKKLRGEPAKLHIGYPFSNAWVLNTAEAMCVALTLDAEGDAEILKAQQAFRDKLEQWIPILLAAQEPDGYFQTRYTLGTRYDRNGVVAQRWDARWRGEHEGYVAGYFIEMGIAHHIATGGKDRRLYDASLKLADCWVNNVGPAPKKPWYDGHQEIEQALVRLGRYVNDLDGPGKGQKYVDLARFLLDSRSRGQRVAGVQGGGDFFTGSDGGEEYDQSHRPVVQQYTAVGHAVRAAYSYSAMADVAIETGDPAYWSAIRSIWHNLVDTKYYVTGGIGSGETSEGFGPDYSLPSGSAYVESCSSCGLLFMQYKLNLATRDAKYADLYETTLYNAILGNVDLPAQNFTYTNSLDSDEARYKWHVCPCCVGNIPRTLLMLPTWQYATAPDAVYVNLFAPTTVNVGKVGGADVELLQETRYPWDGAVKLNVNPSTPARFAMHVRAPRREVSALYTATPSGDGLASLKVNGEAVDATPGADGYVKIDREWKAGDQVTLELPLPAQTITASEKVAATRGRVAIRRGPLIYNVETADRQNVEAAIGGQPKLDADWSPDLLGGIVRVRGTWADGSPLLAVPHYARLNRGGRSLVWIKQ